MVELAALDIAVMAAYFVVIMALGFWVGRGERDALDYFLAARTLLWNQTEKHHFFFKFPTQWNREFICHNR